jgi:hypothetical protein
MLSLPSMHLPQLLAVFSVLPLNFSISCPRLPLCLQGRERFAERWGFDTRLGQPLPDHPRFKWVLDETRT